MNLKKTIVILCFLPIFQVFSREVNTTIYPGNILIGEHARITFTVDIPEDARLEMPVFNEKISDNIEILQYGETQITAQAPGAGMQTVSRTLTVTSWEEGLHVVEPFDFFLIKGADTTAIPTQAFLLEVMPFDLEEADLRDIKSIISVPITLAELRNYILGVLLLIVLIWLIVRYFKNRKKAPEKPKTIWQKPEIPAHVAALNSLEQLKALKLWQQGKVKEYHIRLNDILRHYIERRFNIRAMEMTSSEILSATNSIAEVQIRKETLRSLLYLADMTKFAKYIPSPEDNERSMDESFEFVHQTKQQAVEEGKQNG